MFPELLFSKLGMTFVKHHQRAAHSFQLVSELEMLSVKPRKCKLLILSSANFSTEHVQNYNPKRSKLAPVFLGIFTHDYKRH